MHRWRKESNVRKIDHSTFSKPQSFDCRISESNVYVNVEDGNDGNQIN